jgi:hypothetical protein
MRAAATVRAAFHCAWREEPSYLGREHRRFALSIEDGGAAGSTGHCCQVAVIGFGQHNHAQTPGAIVVAQPPCEFDPVDRTARIRIGDEDVDARRPCEIDGAMPVRHRDDVEPDRSQKNNMPLPRRVIAVDQEDANDHAGERSLACRLRTAHRRNN